jgi:ketosteroid isomerase-like protein
VDGHDVDGPYLNGDQFAVKYRFDTTNKKTRERTSMNEIAVYTVKEGKIVQERFFDARTER